MRSTPLTENLYLISIKSYTNSNLVNNESEDKNGYSLIFCLKGKLNILINNTVHHVKKDEYIISKTSNIGKISQSKRKDNLIYIIQFDGKKAHDLIKKENTATSFEATANSSYVYYQKIQHIVDCLKMGYRKENLEYVSGKLWTLLILIKNTGLKTPDESGCNDIITKAIVIMKDQLRNKLTLEELASKLDYSPSHLSTLFRKKVGETPINYYNQLKIQQAATYLQHTNMQIKEIANTLQFYDEFYFSKVFKRYMSITPSKFKKKYSLMITK